METYTFIGNAVKSESGNHGFPIKFSGSLYKKNNWFWENTDSRKIRHWFKWKSQIKPSKLIYERSHQMDH